MVPRVVGSNPISHPPIKPRTRVRGFLFGKKPAPSRRLECKAYPKKESAPSASRRGQACWSGTAAPSFLRRGLAAGANIRQSLRVFETANCEAKRSWCHLVDVPVFIVNTDFYWTILIVSLYPYQSCGTLVDIVVVILYPISVPTSKKSNPVKGLCP